MLNSSERERTDKPIQQQTLTDVHTSVGRRAKTYIHQLFDNIVCHLEYFPRPMTDRDEWRECKRNLCCQHALMIYIYIYIYQPLRSGRMWRSIFKQNFIGLNPEFSFSKTGCPDFPTFYQENSWVHTFPNGINVMWNAKSVVQDLKSSHRE